MLHSPLHRCSLPHKNFPRRYSLHRDPLRQFLPHIRFLHMGLPRMFLRHTFLSHILLPHDSLKIPLLPKSLHWKVPYTHKLPLVPVLPGFLHLPVSAVPLPGKHPHGSLHPDIHWMGFPLPVPPLALQDFQD